MMVPYVSFVNEYIFIDKVPFPKWYKVYKLGFRYHPLYGFRCLKLTQENEIHIYKDLNKLGFFFSEGKDWSPASIIRYYKDKGLINGKFMSIYWTSKNIYDFKEI